MALPYYFRVPFGTSGTRAAIPVDAPVDGSINYTIGYGPDYELPRETDPAALTIERDKMNQLFYALSANIQQLQQWGTPWFITTADNNGSPYPYGAHATVLYDNSGTIGRYLSLVDSNTELPTNATNWLQLGLHPAFTDIAQSFTAVQTFSVNGTPVIINSANSTGAKINLKDAGTARGAIGATSVFSAAAYLADQTTLAGGWDNTGMLRPGADATYDLGTVAAAWRNTITNRLTVVGNTAPTNGVYLPAANTLGFAVNSALEVQLTSTAFSPAVSDGNALGTTALMWGDLFLATGGVINWNNGDVTLTHSAGILTLAGTLALGTNSLTMTGSIGATGARVLKGWFTDLQVTNAIAGSITGNAATATALANARTIGGVSFDGTANITVASATGGFTVSGGALALGANNITMTGSLAATGARVLKGWFTDLESTNAIVAAITGNAATATALANARTIGGVSFNGTANITVASATGGFTVSGGDLALGANNLTATGSIGATGGRILKGWFTDLEITNAPTIGGVAATGTGGLVCATSPTLVTPTLGVATATSIAVTGSGVPANGLYLPAANTPAIAVNSAIGVAFGAGTIGANTTQRHTIPAVTADTIALIGATQTFSAKTLDSSCIVQGYRPQNAQTGTTYTLVIGDAGKCVTMNNASAQVLTVPPNSSVAFAVGTEVDLIALGAGQTSIAAGAGVTIRSVSGKLKLTATYSGGTLKKLATDEWWLGGDLAA